MLTSKFLLMQKSLRLTIHFSTVFQEDFKRITNNARKNAEKTVDQTKLRNEGRKQLLQNLNDIFVLAKALKYEVVDDTNTFDLSKL
jgi:excinuclease UvrABC nuclease subunit